MTAWTATWASFVIVEMGSFCEAMIDSVLTSSDFCKARFKVRCEPRNEVEDD